MDYRVVRKSWHVKTSSSLGLKFTALEKKVDDVGHIDTVSDSLVQSLELDFQRCVRLYCI